MPLSAKLGFVGLPARRQCNCPDKCVPKCNLGTRDYTRHQHRDVCSLIFRPRRRENSAIRSGSGRRIIVGPANSRRSPGPPRLALRARLPRSWPPASSISSPSGRSCAKSATARTAPASNPCPTRPAPCAPGSTAEGVKTSKSICPYCAVGCGQLVYHKDDKVISIEGDPDSPISQGNLCPKGAASHQLVTQPDRVTKIKYRAPYATEWTGPRPRPRRWT